ncbi:hypothetical protein P10159_0834 [Citrobacter portucalensis]|nr:hypothetical protein P10159_0834 [Citrobacter portucalensis]
MLKNQPFQVVHESSKIRMSLMLPSLFSAPMVMQAPLRKIYAMVRD